MVHINTSVCQIFIIIVYAEVEVLSWFKLIFIFVHFCVPVML